MAATSVPKLPGTSTISDESNFLRNRNGKFTSQKRVGRGLGGRALAKTGRKHLSKELKEDCEVDSAPSMTRRLRLVSPTYVVKNLRGHFQMLRFVSH